ncbi:hypothetical protein EYF80_024151 [Liparis tanakae]|uniref:Uncharacterized protein n=1 Tax=Liparis tanakae TaxID=230148 RepID=A0A4Z2HLG2_9TELE|nr:hypothetical protein EYF80_024151 [Liparis tanakae]
MKVEACFPPGVTGRRPAPRDSGRVLTRSKWLKEARYSFSCSWVMPLASRVRTWFSISLMVRAMVVSSCSQPTRMCCGGEDAQYGSLGGHLNPPVTFVDWLNRNRKDERFLNELVVSLQLVDLWLVVDDALLVLAEVRQLVLQGPDDVGLVGELPAQALVVLLPGVFLDQSLVALRHQLPDLQQPYEYKYMWY